MDWTNELKNLEAEVRQMPDYGLSAQKHHEIHQVLRQKAAKQQRWTASRKWIATGTLGAACITAAVFGVTMYKDLGTTNTHNASNGQHAVIPHTKGAVFNLPANGTSEHWKMELKASNATPPGPVSTPEMPRYNFVLTYNGTSELAENVTLEEHGIGLWNPDSTNIEVRSSLVGQVPAETPRKVAENMSILPETTELKFVISWLEDGEVKTEQIVIPKQ
ncbi:MAG TPA: hypothetical protein VFV52_08595 [Bacilli bacterium]|nr:hypothetical protein [Bacilli bacterium]